MEKARSEALRANDPKEILRGHWPAVQGFDIRMAIMKLGKSEADTNAAAKLLLALADNE